MLTMKPSLSIEWVVECSPKIQKKECKLGIRLGRGTEADQS